MPKNDGRLGTCRVVLIALAGLAGLAGPAGAATPAFQEAPGRVVFAVDTAAESQSIPTASAVLPDGGVVIGGSGTPGPLTSTGFPAAVSYVAQLASDGQLDPSFGRGGIASIPGLAGPSRIIRQPDGRLLIAGSGPGSTSRLPLAVIARLDADGSPDTSFGTGGVETLGIQAGGVALLPSGDIVATGGAGTTGLVSAVSPTRPGDDRWDVVELTPTGALDPAFGSGGVLTLPPAAGSGQTVGVAVDGDILTTGLDEVTPTEIVEQLTRLTPSGAVDPTFNSGQPVTVPGNEDGGLVAVDPDGSTLVEVANGTNRGIGGRGVVRYTEAGALDPTFGGSGMVSFPSGSPLVFTSSQILPVAGGGLLEIDTSRGVPGVQVKRLTANGVVDPSLGGPNGIHVGLAFGGGDQLPLFDTVNPQSVGGLDDDSFSGSLLQRPDGSYVTVGEVSVVEQTGAGPGPTINRFAVEALTPAFQPDPSFGGPATPLKVSLKLPTPSAATAIHRHNIRVTLTASEPGDARIVVRAAGHIVAQSLLPVLAAGPGTLPVVLTRSGLNWLRGHPHSRLRLSTEARDLLTSTATATGSGSLR
ncbi:MAG TPA: hypothetical protein VG165_03380 [Solirubrobacteraceae bacterium]|jgi:uncharacterized delta-60 repeat protein|nr:hypothetical protein [Solirubrobacteraceae bacterium]